MGLLVTWQCDQCGALSPCVEVVGDDVQNMAERAEVEIVTRFGWGFCDRGELAAPQMFCPSCDRRRGMASAS